MNKEKCFIIDEKILYLEKVLVDFENIPIFFLCKSYDDYYVVLCVDFDNYNYIIVEASLIDVYNLLHENIPMRDVILKQDYYWKIISGEDLLSDTIEKHPMKCINTSLLPEENACFQVFDSETRKYISEFDKNLFNSKFFTETDKASSDVNDNMEEYINVCEDIIFSQLEDLINKVTCSYEEYEQQSNTSVSVKQVNELKRWNGYLPNDVAA